MAHGWKAGGVAVGALLAACGTGNGALDAGRPADAGSDGGDRADAGAGPLALHRGPDLSRAPEVLGPAQGLSHDVSDASHDQAGNLWAVDAAHVFVRRAGLGAVEKFGRGSGLKDDELLGISGGMAGVAWIGYRGQGDANEDPEWMRHTGGAGRVALDGADLDVQNIELSSPPGRYRKYPDGRYKLRTCYRAYGVKDGRHAGDAWFGCNHGVALVTGPTRYVVEHHHPAYCQWNAAIQDCTLHAGDVPAVAFTADGDAWFGGTYGVMLLDYDQGSKPPDFWGAEPVHNQPLWDRPLSPNTFGSEDIVGLAVAADGSLWAASATSGLAHRRADGKVEVFEQAQGLPSNALLDVAADQHGGLWLATAAAGVFRLDLATGELRKAGGLPSDQATRVVSEPTALGRKITVTVRGGVAIYPDGP